MRVGARRGSADHCSTDVPNSGYGPITLWLSGLLKDVVCALLGANPQQVAYTETYMALKSGVVDAQENPFSNTVDMKFYEVQKYLSVVNWQLHPDPFYVNPAWYNSLPDDLKAIFDSVAESTMIYSDTIWLNSEKDYFYFLRDQLEVNELTPEATAKFREAVKPV